jgi:hypothetical protein
MSGGSMNYIYSKLEYEANFRQDTPERRAFAKHLELVIKALHDIEWVDSGDYGPGDENKAIRACLGDAVMLAAVLEAAKEAVATLQAEIDRAEAKR